MCNALQGIPGCAGDSAFQPVAWLGIDFLLVFNEKPHLGGQVFLLRTDRQDVVGGQVELVQHRHQFTALQLFLNLPGGAPAQPQAFAHPAVQQFPIVAVQVAFCFDR